MPERGAKSSAIDFAVKTFDYLVEFESPAGVIGAGTWTQTRTLQPDQQGVKVLSAPKSQNNMCGV